MFETHFFPSKSHDHQRRIQDQVKHLRWSILWEYISDNTLLTLFRNSRSELFLGKGVLKICTKFTGEHPCRSVISIKLQSNFDEITEITLRHGCSAVNLLHIFRAPFPKNKSGRLLLTFFLWASKVKLYS